MQNIISAQMHLISFADRFIWLGALFFVSLILFLYLRGYLIETIFVFISLGSYFYSILLKSLFHMPRPLNAVEGFIQADRFSFPSTHTLIYTAVFGFLFYVFSTLKLKDVLLKHVIKIALAYLICMVGISRVYLGQHYLIDVIFGYIFGGIYLIFLVGLYKKMADSRPKD